jgi:hypothetical protein
MAMLLIETERICVGGRLMVRLRLYRQGVERNGGSTLSSFAQTAKGASYALCIGPARMAPPVRAAGTESSRPTFPCMAKEPVMPPRPQPAEPQQPPVTDPQPSKDPVEPPPRDPQEDRPMRDPVEPDADRPRS